MKDLLDVDEIAARAGLRPTSVRALEIVRSVLREEARRLLDNGLLLTWTFTASSWDVYTGTVTMEIAPIVKAQHAETRDALRAAMDRHGVKLADLTPAARAFVENRRAWRRTELEALQASAGHARLLVNSMLHEMGAVSR